MNIPACSKDMAQVVLTDRIGGMYVSKMRNVNYSFRKKRIA